MKNKRNRIDVRLVNNKKNYLKCTSKPSYISHKIFDNNSVTIRKSKFTLTLIWVWGGGFTPWWFSLNNSKTTKAVMMAFFSM